MYLGETQVAQDNLDTFLSTAEDLKIKGLMQNNQERKPKQTEQKQFHGKEKGESGKEIVEINNESDDPNEIVCLDNDQENNQESTEIEEYYPENTFDDGTHNDYVDNYENVDSQNNVSDPIRTSTVKIQTPLVQRFSTAWKCGICNKVISTRKRTLSHLTEVHKISKFDSVLI